MMKIDFKPGKRAKNTPEGWRMKNIYDSAAQLVGNTPLVRLHNLEQREGLAARLLVKLEGCNPGGSAKDRVAISMLDEAERAGRLHPGDIVVEPTSGNTGVGLCMACAMRGYRAKIADARFHERRAPRPDAGLWGRAGAYPGAKGMAGAIEAAGEIAKKRARFGGPVFQPGKPAAHYAGTGPEIWRDTCGEVAAFVAGRGHRRHHHRRGPLFEREKQRRIHCRRGTGRFPRVKRRQAGRTPFRALARVCPPCWTLAFTTRCCAWKHSRPLPPRSLCAARGAAGGHLVRRGAVGGHAACPQAASSAIKLWWPLPDTGERLLHRPVCAGNEARRCRCDPNTTQRRPAGV